MPVHEVATRGFGDAAESYEQARPTYAADAVAHLVDRLRIRPGNSVLDLGAGTGKLTRLLVATGADLVAVEPLAGMRTVLHREVPSVRAVGAVAEALPFATASLGAAVAAQAFHWFDAPAALSEIARVLHPGGRMGLVWNAWDDSVDWIARVHRVVADARATEEWARGHGSRDWVSAAINATARFGPVERVRFRHGQQLTREGVVERVATTSHVASASLPERDRVLDTVRHILDTDPETRGAPLLDFAYTVDVFTCERP